MDANRKPSIGNNSIELTSDNAPANSLELAAINVVADVAGSDPPVPLLVGLTVYVQSAFRLVGSLFAFARAGQAPPMGLPCKSKINNAHSAQFGRYSMKFVRPISFMPLALSVLSLSPESFAGKRPISVPRISSRALRS